MSDYYNSKYTGAQIDEGIELALAHEDTIEQLATKAEVVEAINAAIGTVIGGCY